MDKFEQMFDLLLNEDNAGAAELFHEVVVEHGRNIYKEIAQEAGVKDEEALEESSDEDLGEGKAAHKEGEELEEGADVKDYDQNPGMKKEKADLKEDEMSELSDEVEDEEEGSGSELDAEGEGELDDEMSDSDPESDDVESRLDDLESAMAEIIANLDAEGGMDDELDGDMGAEGDMDDMGGEGDLEGGDDAMLQADRY